MGEPVEEPHLSWSQLQTLSDCGEKCEIYDTHELAWAAGFFDGEGCTYVSTTVSRLGPYSRPGMSVAQNRPEPLYRFQAAVRLGRISVDKRRGMWVWRCQNWRDLQAALALLWRFMGTPKREQATSVLMVCKPFIVTGRRLSPTCGRGHDLTNPANVYLSRNPRPFRPPIRACKLCRKEWAHG